MDVKSTPTVSTPSAARSSFSGSAFEVVFLVIVIIVAYWYLVSPKSTQFDTLDTQLTNLREQESKLDTQQTVFNRLVQELDSESQSVSQLDQLLPLDGKPGRLYVLLENLIQTAGLGAGTVSVETNPQEVVAGDRALLEKPYDPERKLVKQTITISAAGTMDQMNNFLQLLETSGRILEVSDLDVNQGRGNQLLFRVGLSAYAYLPETATTSGVK
jgi:Tfp pilus assembly protein PilO